MELSKVKTVQGVMPAESILRNKKFLFLWIATAFTGLSLSMYLISETWFVVNRLKQDSWLGIVMMITTIPRILLMAVGGVVADKLSRSQTMFLSNFTRGLLVAGLVVLLLTDVLNVWLLLVFAFFFGVLDAFFWPASNSFIPMIVQKSQITRANSIIQTTSQLTLMIGPALAGFIIKFYSFAGAFGTAAILLIVSSLIMKSMKEESIEKGDLLNSSNLKADLKEGIRYVKGMPFLLTVMSTSIIVNFLLVGPINIGLPLLVEHTLKGDILDLSYLESSLAIGMFAGAIITGVVNFKKKRAIMSLSLIAILGVLNGLLSQMTFLWYGIAIMVIAGICLAISNIISPSLTQELVEPAMMGRVQSLMATAAMGFTPLSFAFVSALLSFGVTIQVIMLISSLLMTLFVFFVLWRVKIVWTID
ncbi:MFS transporter [Bacillus suaedaesalsae]|uniref:MFS transporter n=1 Tax=Bacillus suaedaesalsae TaxID=2810349 RepID=A0ABS2DFC1_9BACI|nr:MFS transporter [Bacillus suaedaesalsae]MBM6617168.1 MFS transporter [Bacillus suaedaesalsae]